MDEIIHLIQKHIPSHSESAIRQSLRSDLKVISYKHLNIDNNAKWSLGQIMDLAVEAGFLKGKIDINALVDDSFATNIE